VAYFRALRATSLASRGRVLLDACHSGAVGTAGWATDPEAKVLQDAMDMENVHRADLVKAERAVGGAPGMAAWRAGASLLGCTRRSSGLRGIITRSALTDTMENELQSLTKGRQYPRQSQRRSFHGQPLRERRTGASRGNAERKPAKLVLGPSAARKMAKN
jgi:hypothetical protein